MKFHLYQLLLKGIMLSLPENLECFESKFKNNEQGRRDIRQDNQKVLRKKKTLMPITLLFVISSKGYFSSVFYRILVPYQISLSKSR
jgi:hypothetical protein